MTTKNGHRKKICVVFGTRPEAIKMAPLIPALASHPEWFDVVVCSSGQHREMVAQVLDIFDIRPTYDLHVMVANQTLAGLTSTLIAGFSDVFAREKPDMVLVHGDTTTSLAAALSAYYNKISIGHVEAGLRTFDPYHPFPEEMNRRLVDSLSRYLFAPTERARANLLREGIPDGQVWVTGNTVIDALLHVVQKGSALPLALDWENRKVILVTAHRRESFGGPIDNICRALLKIAETYPDVEIIYPVHYNPKVWDPVHEHLGGRERIHLTDPLSYPAFVQVMSKSYLILTDSGGIQEEAPALGVPVLVLRDVTERPEAAEAGTVRVVGTDFEKIVSSVAVLMHSGEHEKMARSINPYGDGHSARRIVDILRNEETYEYPLDPSRPGVGRRSSPRPVFHEVAG